MEVDKVADMVTDIRHGGRQKKRKTSGWHGFGHAGRHGSDKVADIEMDIVADIDIDINININMEIQFGERVSHRGWLIKLFRP